MLTTTIIVLAITLLAAILFYALYQNRDVKFNVKIPGANVSLETKGGPGRSRER